MDFEAKPAYTSSPSHACHAHICNEIIVMMAGMTTSPIPNPMLGAAAVCSSMAGRKSPSPETEAYRVELITKPSSSDSYVW